jgi:hypothetical protein
MDVLAYCFDFPLGGVRPKESIPIQLWSQHGLAQSLFLDCDDSFEIASNLEIDIASISVEKAHMWATHYLGTPSGAFIAGIIGCV